MHKNTSKSDSHIRTLYALPHIIQSAYASWKWNLSTSNSTWQVALNLRETGKWSDKTVHFTVWMELPTHAHTEICTIYQAHGHYTTYYTTLHYASILHYTILHSMSKSHNRPRANISIKQVVLLHTGLAVGTIPNSKHIPKYENWTVSRKKSYLPRGYLMWLAVPVVSYQWPWELNPAPCDGSPQSPQWWASWTCPPFGSVPALTKNTYSVTLK